MSGCQPKQLVLNVASTYVHTVFVLDFPVGVVNLDGDSCAEVAYSADCDIGFKLMFS